MFGEKISRARGNDSRAQYARLKAYALIDSNDRTKINAAVDLLQKSLTEWPSEFEQHSGETYAALGDAYRSLKKYELAATAYEKALTWGNVRHTAYWDYPEMIVTEGFTDLYSRALQIVNRLNAERDFVMEFQRFNYHAVRAVVLYEQGEANDSRREAEAALSAVKVKKSVFSRHPKVGLVPAHRYAKLIGRLNDILGA